MFAIARSNIKYLNDYTGVYIHCIYQQICCKCYFAENSRRVMKITLLNPLSSISCADFSLSL